jgi:hypothetical protein
MRYLANVAQQVVLETTKQESLKIVLLDILQAHRYIN